MRWRVPDGTPEPVAQMADEALAVIREELRAGHDTDEQAALVQIEPGADPATVRAHIDALRAVLRDRHRMRLAAGRLRLLAAAMIREEVCGRVAAAPPPPTTPTQLTFELPLPRTPADAVRDTMLSEPADSGD
jgi:hypothetical protein